jgi:hypothetical protein
VPIAFARADPELLDLARRWWEAHTAGLPRSDYALLMGTATALQIGTPPLADIAELLPAFDLDHAGPSWLAAVEVIIDRLLEEGDTERAAEAVRRIGASLVRTEGDPLACGVYDLVQARLSLVRGDTDDAVSRAQSAVDAFAELEVPWWHAKAIRTLASAGAGAPQLVAEAAALEARLGLASSP